MNKNYKLVLIISGVVLAVILLLSQLFSIEQFRVLNPKGIIAMQQRGLMITLILIMLVIVVPALFMTYFVAWKYRDGNNKATNYKPNWEHSTRSELAMWGAPLLIVAVLSMVTWYATHALHPLKPLASEKRPVTIQVVALQWKWLFIYPEQNIATVNFVQFPVDTPVKFELTADAPMNSFWIPQLGGQIYAMNGMATHLNLMASEIGDYDGSAAEVNGRGFADMTFVARASSAEDFNTWVQTIRRTENMLSFKVEYDQLVEPSERVPIAFFARVEHDLFDKVRMKFMPDGDGGMH
jgi:cytochrome o ubiquinol oxidase subunit II